MILLEEQKVYQLRFSLARILQGDYSQEKYPAGTELNKELGIREDLLIEGERVVRFHPARAARKG